MKKNTTYLITGGAGFIGSNIISELIQRGENVRVLDNLSTGSLDNLADYHSGIEFIEGDIRDFWTVREAIVGCDYVIHLASIASVPLSIENPLTCNAVNIDGSLNVLECARLEEVKKVVFASSTAIYGDTDQLPVLETVTPRPQSPYAVSKLAIEHYMRVFWEIHKLPTVSLRYFNIFGPGQNPDSEYSAVIPKFIKALSTGARPKVYGDGNKSRDFTHISHVVRANLIAATSPEIVGTEYNVASGSQRTINQLLFALCEIFGVSSDIIYMDERPGEIEHSCGSVDKLKRDFGISYELSFDEGLRNTVEWFAKQKFVRISAADIQ